MLCTALVIIERRVIAAMLPVAKATKAAAVTLAILATVAVVVTVKGASILTAPAY
jgi:putative Ca2+/H+ antiporter (TMEM165/GDT1 family)